MALVFQLISSPSPAPAAHDHTPYRLQETTSCQSAPAEERPWSVAVAVPDAPVS
eukprot:COSAG06_NODE_52044_length_308_cov_0.746411_1_plen_53_part_01